jgi:short subunit dehydrogenase-like uncharacterized protein
MTRNSKWLLYGAYGYSGRLILEEALRRGHKPVVAGRDEKKLSSLAQEFGLEMKVLSLQDRQGLKKALEDVSLVFNAAGPFIHTFEPIVNACLETGRHYLDITGEIPVFERAFSLDITARQKEICILPGAGFDVVPTDCLAKYLSEQLPDADSLELAFAGLSRMSRGTIKTMIEFLPGGGLVRRDGKLITVPMGAYVKKVPFPGRKFTVMSIPWGDLSTAYRSTGIKNITTFMAYPPRIAHSMRYTGPVLAGALRFGLLRRSVQYLVSKLISGPDESLRNTASAFVYARVEDRKGNVKEAWLETIEVYKFTAHAGVRSVEGILGNKLRGTLTPSLAFGSDFVLTIEGTKRYDELP